MTINGRQQTVIWGAIVAGILMGVVPPWQHVTDFSWNDITNHSVRSAGYAFIGTPPEPEPFRLFRNHSKLRDLGVGVRIDAARLLVQYVVIGMLTAGLFFAFRERSEAIAR